MKNRISSKLHRAVGDTASVTWNRAWFRRLKSREQVWIGDYIKSASGGYEPWNGPGGFRADSFAKPVYRMKRTSIPRLALT